jgi:hypothetical protein
MHGDAVRPREHVERKRLRRRTAKVKIPDHPSRNVVSAKARIPWARHERLTQHESPIIIGHGCLLIPVAVLIWWYWTKRTVQRVVRRLVTSHGHHATCSGPTPEADNHATADDGTKDAYSSFQRGSDEADPFYSWEDVMHQEESEANGGGTSVSSTTRFVRWFKGRGSRNARARRRVHAATLHTLRCGSGATPFAFQNEEADDHNPRQQPMLSQSDSSESETSMIHRVFWTNVAGPASQYTWQCIHNTTIEVELCALEISHSSSSLDTTKPSISLLASKEQAKNTPDRDITR